jgi:hypothetical protein
MKSDFARDAKIGLSIYGIGSILTVVGKITKCKR